MSKSYHIVTYGCQMNVHESEKLAGILRANGYTEESEAPKRRTSSSLIPAVSVKTRKTTQWGISVR